MIKKRFSDVERANIVELAHKCVFTEDGKPGLEYLTDKRGLKKETIIEFKLGYIPDFIDHQLKNRIIFPLYDPSGNLIAVHSRTISDNDSSLPKYWHEGFEKSFYLYGMHLARDAIRKFNWCLVVEGQFDILQLFNYGVRNVVALSGNKMSQVQMSVIRRYCDEVVLLLDRDENKAGQRGSEKIMEDRFCDFGRFNLTKSSSNESVFIKEKILSVTLPENSDPDEFIRKHGINTLKNIIKGKRLEFSSCS